MKISLNKYGIGFSLSMLYFLSMLYIGLKYPETFIKILIGFIVFGTIYMCFDIDWED